MASTLVDLFDDDDGNRCGEAVSPTIKMLQTHTHLHTHCTPPSPS